jgi:hypothetical protein
LPLGFCKRLQYKEFLVSMSGAVGTDSTPEGKRSFAVACSALHLIGSSGVLVALHELIDAIESPKLSRDAHDALLSKLIWEIRQDAGIPGTPDESKFSARLWSSGLKRIRQE